MDIEVEQELDFPADTVWAVLSNFSNLSWNAPVVDRVVVEGEGVGMLRRVYMSLNNTPLVQRLDSMDHAERRFSFQIIGGMQVELTNYQTHVHVLPLGDDRCRLEAVLHFDQPLGAQDDELLFLFEDSIRVSIKRLQGYLERREQPLS